MTRPVAFSLIAAALVLLTIAVVALWLATEAAADLPTLRDEVDRYRADVAKLTETVHQANQRIDSLTAGIEERETPQSSFPQVSLEEPATRPILRVPTDTVPQDAAIDAELRNLSGSTASGYGRHAAR